MADDASIVYRKQFDDLIKRKLFSYPFYDKSDEELIIDAICVTKNNLEFSLFKLGPRDVKTVVARGKIVETRYLPLISLVNEVDIKPIEIKISSFKYPALFMSSVLDKVEKNRSTFNYKTFDEYSDLYRTIEKHYGERILITTCWDNVTDFISTVKCVNLVAVPSDDEVAAEIIRECFLRDRRKFIDDMLQKPKKYMSFCPVDEEILAGVFEEYKQVFLEELDKLDNYSISNNNDYDDQSTSPYDLARDNYYALTDGQEGDYPSDLHRFDDNDDDEIAKMMGF